jgi:acyl-CoA thioesterase-1
MITKILIILLSQLLIQQDGPTRILFFGDSLTAGYGLTEEQAFPALVGRELNKGDQAYEIINAGLSGETSAGGNSRIDWVLQQPVDVLILELGANDGLRGLPLEQTRSNLQSIIDKTRAKNPDVKLVIAGMEVPPNLGTEYTREFRTIFPELAQKNDAALIPFLLDGVAGNKELNLPDGIHPNPEGHRIVASNVLRALRSVL